MRSVDQIQLQTVIADQFGVERETLQSATFEVLGADSLDMVELLMAIEDAFSIELDEHDDFLFAVTGPVTGFMAKVTQLIEATPE